MNEQQTKIPPQHVVGVLASDKAARDAADALRREGFDDTMIMSHVDSVGEGVNPIAGFLERVARHLSDETGYLDQYRDATEQGKLVIAVKAEEEEEADRASRVLESKGAVNVRYFGMFAVSDKTPATNPSAPSDDRP
jgi:hypothetical protein